MKSRANARPHSQGGSGTKQGVLPKRTTGQRWRSILVPRAKFELDRLARQRLLGAGLDPLALTHSLGIIPDPWQEAVLRSRAQQIILNCSRQAGKSTVASVLALHTALSTPDGLVLLIASSERQSLELFRKVQGWLSKLDLKSELLEDTRVALKLPNGARIVALPARGDTIRGYSGPTLIIEDEAARVVDDIYMTIRPMLATSGGRLVLMSTPGGRRGHFFEEWANSTQPWHRVEILASECPRITPAFLQQERASLGNWFYRQEYECQFMDTVDQLFKYDLIMRAITPDVVPLFAESVQPPSAGQMPAVTPLFPHGIP